MPFVNENEYQIFTWSKKYKIDNEKCKNKLVQLEQFREFIWSARPFIWLPIIIISSILGAILSYAMYHNFEYIKQITIWITIIIYVLVSIVYYLKIKKAINCNK